MFRLSGSRTALRIAGLMMMAMFVAHCGDSDVRVTTGGGVSPSPGTFTGTTGEGGSIVIEVGTIESVTLECDDETLTTNFNPPAPVDNDGSFDVTVNDNGKRVRVRGTFGTNNTVEGTLDDRDDDCDTSFEAARSGVTQPTRTPTPGADQTQTPAGGQTQTPGAGETQTPGAGATFTPGGPTATPTPTGGNACPTKLTLEGQGAQADLDTGTSGLAFDNGVVEHGTITVSLACPGTEHPNCGDCTVGGPIASTTVVNNERCSTDPSIKCTNGAPESACSGSCVFFFGAPLALSSGGVGVCVTNQVIGQITGTGNPDTGSGASVALIGSRVHTAADNFKPCPTCSGAGFNQTGTCSEGPRVGLACTVHGTSPDFGNTSLDCPPNPGANVSGANGLQIALNPTTGTSALHPATGATACVAVPFNGKACYCPGQKKANECTTGICVVPNEAAGGEGTCQDSDPTDQFCSNQDFRPCISAGDCINGGTCTISKPRKCSGQTDETFNITGDLTRIGTPSSTTPVLVSTFCVPAVSAPGVNTAGGLPGPGALKLPTRVCYDDVCTF